ncbi:MAG TPA: MBL fold metallo-hydrolase [Mycobacteriales bacterium]|nr:MBL fold metallo-hydrolase [Mycobacteriales bacterium]
MRVVTSRAAVVLAPNPSPMTLEGTNTWVLRAEDSEQCIVVDPGPDDLAHLQAVADCGPVAVILLTHGHPDHSAGARWLADHCSAPVRACDPAHRLGSEGLGAGDVVAAAGVEVRVVATPGHTSDSLSFVLAGETGPEAVLTGDTILGRGTSVVAHPDGVLRDYLASLQVLQAMGDLMVLPGHGPELASAGQVARDYLTHREERLEQVRAALAAGATSAQEVVAVVYADVDRALWPAATQSVRAQLAYLR